VRDGRFRCCGLALFLAGFVLFSICFLSHLSPSPGHFPAPHQPFTPLTRTLPKEQKRKLQQFYAETAGALDESEEEFCERVAALEISSGSGKEASNGGSGTGTEAEPGTKAEAVAETAAEQQQREQKERDKKEERLQLRQQMMQLQQQRKEQQAEQEEREEREEEDDGWATVKKGKVEKPKVCEIDAVSQKRAAGAAETSIISHLFHGTLRSEVKYKSKKAVSVTFERFHCLPLDINGSDGAASGGRRGESTLPPTSIGQALCRYFTEEVLHSDKVRVYWGACVYPHNNHQNIQTFNIQTFNHPNIQTFERTRRSASAIYSSPCRRC
jgi:hypothetical protein